MASPRLCQLQAAFSEYVLALHPLQDFSFELYFRLITYFWARIFISLPLDVQPTHSVRQQSSSNTDGIVACGSRAVILSPPTINSSSLIIEGHLTTFKGFTFRRTTIKLIGQGYTLPRAYLESINQAYHCSFIRRQILLFHVRTFKLYSFQIKFS